MHELARSEYLAVAPLFEDIRDNRAHVFGVLEGNNAGRVFVDNPMAPHTVFIDADYVLLGGNAANARFNHELKAYLVNESMPRLTDGHLLILSFSEAWKETLHHLLKDYGVSRVIRNVYELDPELFRARHSGWQLRVPKGYRIERMDRPLAEKRGELADLWGSLNSFLANGFGFCVMQGDEVVSSCQTVFVGGGRAELGIGTEKAYRRQGLGTLASCAAIEYSLEQGLLPEWGCFYNEASGKLAHVLGFAETAAVQVSYVKVEQE